MPSSFRSERLSVTRGSVAGSVARGKRLGLFERDRDAVHGQAPASRLGDEQLKAGVAGRRVALAELGAVARLAGRRDPACGVACGSIIGWPPQATTVSAGPERTTMISVLSTWLRSRVPGFSFTRYSCSWGRARSMAVVGEKRFLRDAREADTVPVVDGPGVPAAAARHDPRHEVDQCPVVQPGRRWNQTAWSRLHPSRPADFNGIIPLDMSDMYARRTRAVGRSSEGHRAPDQNRRDPDRRAPPAGRVSTDTGTGGCQRERSGGDPRRRVGLLLVPSLGSANDADMLKMTSPSWIATTRRAENERPSRSRTPGRRSASPRFRSQEVTVQRVRHRPPGTVPRPRTRAWAATCPPYSGRAAGATRLRYRFSSMRSRSAGPGWTAGPARAAGRVDLETTFY